MSLGDLGNLLTSLGSALATGQALASHLGTLAKAFGSLTGSKELPAGGVPCGDGADPKCRIFDVNNIDERVAKHVVEMIKEFSEYAEVRQWAVETVSRKCGTRHCIQPKDFKGEAAAIFEEVQRIFSRTKADVRYVQDHIEVDQFQTPMQTWAWGGGDCDCMTIAMGAALRASGRELKCRIYQTVDADDWNHIALVVDVGVDEKHRRWIVLDASVEEVPDENGRMVPVYAGWEAPPEMVARKRDFEV